MSGANALVKNPQAAVGGGFSGISRSSPYVKPTEQAIAYNPFWIDLSVELIKIDPQWFMPGITVNWLLKESETGLWSRLILGIEATKVEDMRNFLNRFFPWNGLSDNTVEGLLLLGHPSLASEIKGHHVITTCKMNKEDFVHENYSGVLGGELRYQAPNWTTNFNSGRYGLRFIIEG
jgi:hypothetical protein